MLAPEAHLNSEDRQLTTEVPTLTWHLTTWPENSKSTIYSAHLAHPASMHHVPWHRSQKASTAAIFSKYWALKNNYEVKSYFVFPSEMAAVFIQVVGAQAHTPQGNGHLQVTFYVKILFISPTYSAEKNPRIMAPEQNVTWPKHNLLVRALRHWQDYLEFWSLLLTSVNTYIQWASITAQLFAHLKTS